MRKIFKLAITLLKGGGALPSKNTGKSRARWIAPALIGFAFLSFGVPTVFLTFEFYDVLIRANLTDIILPLAIGATSMVVFIFGIFYVISTMYHADDIEMLMYLPLRPYQTLGAKFVTLVVYEYIFEAFILLPILVGFGIKSGAGVMYVIYATLLFLLLPVIALSISAIIVMIVMRFTSFGKNKQVFKFVGGLIAMALAVGFNVAIQTSVSNISGQQLVELGQSSLVTTMSNIFPGVIFAAKALLGSAGISGLLNFVFFTLCCGAATALFLGCGQLLYFKGVIGVSETSAKRKEISASELNKRIQNTPVMLAYIKKEIRLLVRSPIAFMNCVLMNFIWPIIIIVILASKGETLGLVKTLFSSANIGLIFGIVVGLSAFICSTNAITSTAISREGKSLYFAKYIPVSMQKQLAAKTLTGAIFSLIAVIVLLVSGVILGMPIDIALVSLLICLPVVGVCAIAGLLIDVARPKLEWMNEQQAIKQNLNVMLHMLIGVIFAVIAVVPVIAFSLSALAVAIYIVVVFGLLLVMLGRRVKNKAARKLENMNA